MINRIELLITGKNTEYFFKEVLKEKINIYNLDKDKKNIKILIDYEDYHKILKIKTTCKIKILNYYGISKIKSFIKNNYFLIISIIIGIIINLLLSNLIFEIDIITPNEELVKNVTKDLKKYGIDKYHIKPNYKKREKIKENILKIEKNNIEWMEIEEIGTKYIIKIEQRKKNNNINDCKPRHIISKKKATIISIESSSGEIKKKINDYVEKGDIIISGFIYNKDQIKNKRCAIGKVYGEVWYKVKVTMPDRYDNIKMMDNKKNAISLKIFNKKYIFLNRLKSYKENVYNIIEDDIIPITLSIGKYQEIELISKKHNKTTSEKMALKLAEEKMKKKLNKTDEVISKKVLKNKQKNSKIEVEVFFKIKEDITDYLDISNIDIDSLNNKEE